MGLVTRVEIIKEPLRFKVYITAPWDAGELKAEAVELKEALQGLKFFGHKNSDNDLDGDPDLDFGWITPSVSAVEGSIQVLEPHLSPEALEFIETKVIAALEEWDPLDELKVRWGGMAWQAHSPFELRGRLKDAGFSRWNPGSKCWETTEPRVAAKFLDWVVPEDRETLIQQVGTEDDVFRAKTRGGVRRRSKAAVHDTSGRWKELYSQQAALGTAKIPLPDGLELYGYQEDAVRFTLANQHTYWAMDVGMMKAPAALALANLISEPGNVRVLIVVPAGARLAWAAAVKQWLVSEYRKRTPRWVDCVVPYADYPIPAAANMVVVTYEMVRDAKLFRQLRRGYLDLLIFDEPHNLRDPASIQTQRCLGKWSEDNRVSEGLIDRAAQVLFMTTLPAPDRPSKRWSVLRALGIARDWVQYHERYCELRRTGRRTYTSGAANLDELNQMIEGSGKWFSADKVSCEDLPPLTHEVIRLSVEEPWKAIKSERKVLERLKKEFITLLGRHRAATRAGDGGAARQVLARFAELRAEGTAALSAAQRGTSEYKLPAAVRVVRELIDGGIQKVVVFCLRHEVMEQLHEEVGDGAVLCQGDTHSKREALERFQGRASSILQVPDPHCRVLIGDTSITNEGLVMTAGMPVVFVEADYSSIRETDAGIRRATRGGDRVSALHLILEGTIDAMMATAVLSEQGRLRDAPVGRLGQSLGATGPFSALVGRHEDFD